MVKKLILALILFFLIISILFILTTGIYLKVPETLLDQRPQLQEKYIKEPDFMYLSEGWLSDIPANVHVDPNFRLLGESTEWKGTAYIARGPLGGREGIASIHPINSEKGRYVEQDVELPKKKHRLFIGVANIAGMIVEYGLGGFVGPCADVGIRVRIKDLTNEKEYTVFDKIIREGKWYDYSIDLPDYISGKIRIRVESYAADGGCGFWNGEWAAVDYVTIV